MEKIYTKYKETSISLTTDEIKKLFYIETYGCQMNVADSELVVSILNNSNFVHTEEIELADLIFINTCSIRENAEQRVRNRLQNFGVLKRQKPSLIIGILGCMAERLKEKLLEEEKLVDIIAGPDSYRSLPDLVREASEGEYGVNVLLSRDETYADISPVRLDKNGVSAFVTITRGCDNMCAFCVVPFTRGRERSRNPQTIIDEVKDLVRSGYKEVTLLGQNVDKYNWNSGELNFAGLLEKTATVSPDLRVRFSTSYPADITDEVIDVIARNENICKYIHLPVQSGSNNILEKMKRKYTSEYYLDRIKAIRAKIPDCSISTDIITGYCTETEDDHKQTLNLMEKVGFDFSYMFKYSERPNTYAQRNFPDDVPEDIKARRITEIIDLQNKLSLLSNDNDKGKIFKVLIEGISKKSNNQFFGRNSQNKVVVFSKSIYKIGDYVNVKIIKNSSATLLGEIVE